MGTQTPLVVETRRAEVGPDDAARAGDLDRLRAHLGDPAFRIQEGMPRGSDEAILGLSDPPAFTACPNPFLAEFVETYGRPYDPNEPYHREPYAVDVSEGKTDPLYRAHGYHTKVPHLAIVPSILHYTEPGDIVLDGFCGSGMTGVAAQWCGVAPESYRRALEAAWEDEGREAPRWGARRGILNDLSPAATFIAANYNRPFDVDAFASAARSLLDEAEDELGWMYETRHHDGRIGRIEYTVWSEVFLCPSCTGEIVFTDAAMDSETKRVLETITCPHCGVHTSKDKMELIFESFVDVATGEVERRPRRVPVLISYKVGGSRYSKRSDSSDAALVAQIAGLASPRELPTYRLPDCQMTRVGRMRTTNTAAIPYMFLPRAAQALALLWRKANAHPDRRIRQMLLFFGEQAIWGMSVLNRYSPSHFSQVNRALSGVYYVASQTSEVSPWYILDGKLDRLVSAFRGALAERDQAAITTGSCAEMPIPDQSVDYIFTDPPFGENIYYADLNFLVESWHGVFTDAAPEAIVDRAKRKGLPEYGRLMQRCFAEYHRVLKPGRWMTVVFHNSRNAVWNVIQEAILAAGFVVADVRTMDKRQGSYRQVTSSAVKQDLVISAYKPSQAFEERFRVEAGTEEGAWDFVRQHLEQQRPAIERNGVIELMAERQPYLLFDRMVAFHIQRGATVPLSAAEFYRGLRQHFAEEDGMVFLSAQVPEYQAARARADRLGQLALFVSDEKTTIQWLRQQLDSATGGQPRTYQELQPLFLRQLHQARHEDLPELGEMLAQNFLQDERGRWYVPDPNKAEDLEKVRRGALVREFQGYLSGRGRLRTFRSEAVRAGFADAYQRGEYQTVVALAERLPEAVLQEDPDLLMYYDNASLRVE